MNKLFLLLLTLMFCLDVWAVCPVCTVVVGAGLESARLIGVDDLIIGIWAGGLTLSLVFWTFNFLKRKEIKKEYWYVLTLVAYYLFLFSVYLLPSMSFGVNTLYGIDKFLLGTIVGTLGFYFGVRSYNFLKRKNNGHAYFMFQKVIQPLFMLCVLTAIFYFII